MAFSKVMIHERNKFGTDRTCEPRRGASVCAGVSKARRIVQEHACVAWTNLDFTKSITEPQIYNHYYYNNYYYCYDYLY